MERHVSHTAMVEHLVPCQIPVCLVPSDILDCIGNTPMIHMKRASAETGCTILAKAEFADPGGSVKDRIARFIIQEAEKRI
jgi:cysteine synthase